MQLLHGYMQCNLTIMMNFGQNVSVLVHLCEYENFSYVFQTTGSYTVMREEMGAFKKT
jgi:hypothetical protein